MGRGQAVPLVTSSSATGYLFRNRAAYLGSNASSLAVPFSSEWGATTGAVRLAGVWDSPAQTPDVVYATPFSFPGSSVTQLLLQYKMPAWDAISFYNNDCGGITAGSASNIDNGHFDGAGIAAQWVNSSGGTNGATIRFLTIIRVFDHTNALKYTLTAPLSTWRSAAGFGWPAGDGVSSQNALASYVNTPAGAIYDSQRRRGLTVASGDYPVIEIGVYFSAFGAQAGTLNVRMGDSHSFDNTGFGPQAFDNSVSGEPISSNPANGICVFSYRSAT